MTTLRLSIENELATMAAMLAGVMPPDEHAAGWNENTWVKWRHLFEEMRLNLTHGRALPDGSIPAAMRQDGITGGGMLARAEVLNGQLRALHSAGIDTPASENVYQPPMATLADVVNVRGTDISTAELAAFTDGMVYPRKWVDYLAGKTRLAGFNFFACFFTASWFFYRKLYWQAVVAGLAGFAVPMAAGFGVAYASAALDLGWSESKMVMWATIISYATLRPVLGFWANLTYANKAVAAIRKVDALNLDNTAHLAVLKQHGGTNLLAMAAWMIVLIVINRLI